MKHKFYTAGWFDMVKRHVETALAEQDVAAGTNFTLIEEFTDAPDDLVEGACAPGYMIAMVGRTATVTRGVPPDASADYHVRIDWEAMNQAIRLPTGAALSVLSRAWVEEGRVRLEGSLERSPVALAAIHDLIAADTK